MKGVSISAPHSIEVKELPMPQPSAGQAVVKVRAAGICGSDVSAYKGTSLRVIYPRVVGHELVGEIASLPEEAGGFRVGDHVVLEPYFSCGRCYACRRGIPNNCEDLKVLGVQVEGGMTEYIAHPLRKLYKLPQSLGWAEAAMVEPLSIGVHAVHRAGLRGGELAVILGSGTIGLLTAQVCRAYGAKVVLMDVLPSRLEFASSLGFTQTVNVADGDPVGCIEKLSHGEMAPAVFECSGAASSINLALELAANSGRVCLVGWAKGLIEFNQPGILVKELNIFGSRCSDNEFPECIEMIASHAVNVLPMITRKNSLEELASGFDELLEHPERYLKVMGIFDQGAG